MSNLTRIGYWSWHPGYGTEFSEHDITDADRKAGWRSQPAYTLDTEKPRAQLTGEHHG